MLNKKTEISTEILTFLRNNAEYLTGIKSDRIFHDGFYPSQEISESQFLCLILGIGINEVISNRKKRENEN